MTAVICYHTQFFVNKKDSLILSFAFGDNVSIRSVLILPTFLSIDATLNLPHDTRIFSEINFTLPLLLDPQGKELPDRVFFHLCVPRDLPFNLSFLIYHTDMDDFTSQVSQGTPWVKLLFNIIFSW